MPAQGRPGAAIGRPQAELPEEPAEQTGQKRPSTSLRPGLPGPWARPVSPPSESPLDASGNCSVSLAHRPAPSSQRLGPRASGAPFPGVLD